MKDLQQSIQEIIEGFTCQYEVIHEGSSTVYEITKGLVKVTVELISDEIEITAFSGGSSLNQTLSGDLCIGPVLNNTLSVLLVDEPFVKPKQDPMKKLMKDAIRDFDPKKTNLN